MGKASSSKKVARAAGTGGGRTNRNATPWTFVGLIGLIVIVGVALTFTSRSRYQSQKNATTAANASVAPTVGGTPWYEGVAFYACNAFLPPVNVATDKLGLTTPGDGVIHIAPKVKAAAGKNATLGEFATAVGMTLTANELQLPGGKRYTNGDDCGGTAAKLYIKQYPYAGAVGTVSTQDPRSILLTDSGLVTIAFVTPADKGRIPAPPASVVTRLKDLVSPPATAAPTTTLPTTATTRSTTATTRSTTATTRSTTPTT